MNTREYAKMLINQVPEGKLLYVIAYLQGAALPDRIETSQAKKQENENA